MDKGITILIADRNRHVREFLKRELAAVGYRVRLAKNGREVLNWVNHYPPPDLLILDLNLPDEPELGILEKLHQAMPVASRCGPQLHLGLRRLSGRGDRGGLRGKRGRQHRTAQAGGGGGSCRTRPESIGGK